MQPQKSLCSSLRGEKFSCVGACGFRREGVKLSEAGEGARIPARAAVRPRLDGLRASLAIFSALFFA